MNKTVNHYYIIQQWVTRIDLKSGGYWGTCSISYNDIDRARKCHEACKTEKPHIRFRIIEVVSTVVE